jgi:hypothetical protein
VKACGHGLHVLFRRGSSGAGALIAATTFMWIVLGILLFLGWLMLKLVVGVTSFAIHALLAVALVSLVVHFVSGRSKTATQS